MYDICSISLPVFTWVFQYLAYICHSKKRVCKSIYSAMRKIVIFSILLLLGLLCSQLLPGIVGAGYEQLKDVADFIMLSALAYIMINVGSEFEIERHKLKSYGRDYLVAMGTAALPWVFVSVYFLSLLPATFFTSTEAWMETLLIGRFAAPTSAGILFTMLAAAGLAGSWMFRKARILAIFDDLDTIMLMIPLQIAVVYSSSGQFSFELLLSLVIIGLLIWVAWKGMNKLRWSVKWPALLIYAVVVTALCEGISTLAGMLSPNSCLHIEVLMPAFVLGVVLVFNHHEQDKKKEQVDGIVSFVFMFLVGLSTPLFINAGLVSVDETSTSITAAQPMLPWSEIIFHVLMITLLSNIGKLVPIFFYRERRLLERLALSVSMFARGEVGAGILIVAIGYNYGGPILIIAILALVFNLILTGFFIYSVKKMLVKVYKDKSQLH